MNAFIRDPAHLLLVCLGKILIFINPGNQQELPNTLIEAFLPRKQSDLQLREGCSTARYMTFLQRQATF